ncbi:MAG: hypothetical protein HOQ17_11550, partial [Gemmatimonadaceae bacterium]|nr:hypothetical protein [Gemmatimonadaceae bacterium]NUP72329.1 hypothetical protein [Gemmatimonadaceae bacterium]NUS33686.1 hypothetical protein [Gemmatimonadaceae bacterium]NUS48292.1 hypothetical protein [Gemmatimonadaceae bacterium]
MRSRVRLFLILTALLPALPARSQTETSLPFAPGERLTFTGRVRAGVTGEGSLWVEGPVELRGT